MSYVTTASYTWSCQLLPSALVRGDGTVLIYSDAAVTLQRSLESAEHTTRNFYPLHQCRITMEGFYSLEKTVHK